MNFFSIQSQMRNTNLSYNTQRKKELSPKEEATKREAMSTEERQIYDFKQSQDRNREASKIQAIDNKLKSGQKLTDEEKKELKAKNPELYEEAVKVEQERAAYENSIKKARTKEEVEKIKSTALCKFSSEIKEVINNPVIPKGKKLELTLQIGRRFNGVMDVHNEFVKSTNYTDLPDDNAQLDEIVDSQKAEMDLEDFVEQEKDGAVDENTNAHTDTDNVETNKSEVSKTEVSKKAAKKNVSKKATPIKTAPKLDIGAMYSADFKGALIDIKI